MVGMHWTYTRHHNKHSHAVPINLTIMHLRERFSIRWVLSHKRTHLPLGQNKSKDLQFNLSLPCGQVTGTDYLSHHFLPLNKAGSWVRTRGPHIQTTRPDMVGRQPKWCHNHHTKHSSSHILIFLRTERVAYYFYHSWLIKKLKPHPSAPRGKKKCFLFQVHGRRV